MLRFMGLPELLIILVIGVIVTVTTLIPYWKIFGKAGFSPWLALLMIVPLANVIVLWIFAFSPWTVAAPAARPAPPVPSRAFCSKCGNTLAEGTVYCAFCGTKRP